jgi:hypothetical protein
MGGANEDEECIDVVAVMLNHTSIMVIKMLFDSCPTTKGLGGLISLQSVADQ